MDAKDFKPKLILNFDPEEVAEFLSTLHIIKVEKGGHELIFGDDI